MWHFFDEGYRKINYPFSNDIQYVLCHLAREESGSQITKQTYSIPRRINMYDATGCRGAINKPNMAGTQHRAPPFLILSNDGREKEIG